VQAVLAALVVLQLDAQVDVPARQPNIQGEHEAGSRGRQR